jgi:hypothetical protein
MTTIAEGKLQNETFLPVFEEIADWQLSVVRRYPEASFSVLVVEPQLSKEGTAREVLEQLAEFYAMVRGVVRASDLTAQGSGNEVWLLLPHSDANGALMRLRAHFAKHNAQVRIEAAGVDLQHGRALPESAAQLMGDLRHTLP